MTTLNPVSLRIIDDFFDNIDENFQDAYLSHDTIEECASCIKAYVVDCVKQEADALFIQENECLAMQYAGLFIDQAQWQEIATYLIRGE